jgi:SAM-dependent methyltransferase
MQLDRIAKILVKKVPPIKRILDERDYLRSVASRAGLSYEVPLAKAIAQGKHREAIGGRWEELGKLQFDYLVRQGLKPENYFLDVGCGSLRGGVKFIGYLNPGHYWGIDNSQVLLEAGWNIELPLAEIQRRQPREQLVCLTDFQFQTLKQNFDYALAQSVFTHINLNDIRLCLIRLAPVIREGGKFFATYLHVPDDHPWDQPLSQPACTSYAHRDPFHYKTEDFFNAIKNLPWELLDRGEWGHPGGTYMLEFQKTA